jgi:hypothetical protein
MRSVHALLLGILLTLAAPGLRAQAKPSVEKPAAPASQAAKPAQVAPKAASGPAAKPAAPATQAAAKPAQAAPKAASGPTAKPAAPATQAASKPAQAPAQPAAKPAAKPAAAAPKPGAKTASKPTQAAAKPPAVVAKKAAKPTNKKAAAPGGTPAQEEIRIARRDPFESLVGRQQKQAQAGPAIAGKPGLVISTLRLDGVVRAPNGMIAVVTNPQQRTYFLREGDQLYDGRVEKIIMDSVSFHEVGKDAFGKPVERQVNKRIYSSPGEQQ